ncbi:ADP-ribosylglycohydrolase family protein [Deferrisoma camini]|uniref:ADP-ribosylglycohydrolase family protein n=1 Tax=Deferrisoma camini TaxID=1035120 RepID=UPI00046D4EF3|nr:ADP-ribosylglycohydrolase family protein [Deferrisoma camini]
MIGAIAGDIIGASYERHNITAETDWPLFDAGARSRFTDDTVLTVATADAILTGADYGAKYREWYRRYPDRGFGPGFRRWAGSNRDEPYGSLGNGSAMRVSPVAWASDTLETVLREARRSAEVTHNHPEGIKGAQAVAAAFYGGVPPQIRDEALGRLDGPLLRVVRAFCRAVGLPLGEGGG